MRLPVRLQLIGIGLFVLILWLGCWAATVGPGSDAVYMQWAGGNVLALLAGVAFGMAVKAR
jgi:hypothetical protein